MAKVGRWSTTPGSNNSTPPDGWPEGQAASTVNDCAREMMAGIRTVFQDAQYFDQDFTPTFITASSFSVPGNQTSAIHAGRRLKLFDAVTRYGTVSTASFTTVTTIHVNVDSGGSLTSSLSSFGIAIVSNTNDSLPRGLGRFIPVGGIIMWSGSIGAIPSGWSICDGTNGTPDLRNRFIVGAGSTYAVADTGGTADAITVAHTHTASTGSNGSHTHGVTDLGHVHSGGLQTFAGGGQNASGSPNFVNNTNTGSNTTGISINADGSHTHSVSVTSAGAAGTNANLPPYYALAYIMCLSAGAA